MSIASKVAAGFPAGAVQLFSADQTPSGWERISAVRVPTEVYEYSPCLTLLAYDALPGGASLSNLTSSALVNDYTSQEHVFVARDSTLRRQHLLTGLGTMCPNAPTILAYSSILSSASTPHGLFFYGNGAGGGPAATGILRYSVAENAWSTMTRMHQGLISFGVAYDRSRGCVFLVGGRPLSGNSAVTTVLAHYPSRNAIEAWPFSLPAPASLSGACIFKDQLVFAALNSGVVGALDPGYYSFDPDTGDCAAMQFVGDAPAQPSARVTFTVSEERLYCVSGSKLYVFDQLTDGRWSSALVPVAGLSTLGAVTGYPALHTPVHGSCTLVTTTTGLYLLSLEGHGDVPTASYFYARKL